MEDNKLGHFSLESIFLSLLEDYLRVTKKDTKDNYDHICNLLNSYGIVNSDLYKDEYKSQRNIQINFLKNLLETKETDFCPNEETKIIPYNNQLSSCDSQNNLLASKNNNGSFFTYNFCNHKIIGTGGFSKVYCAYNKIDANTYAIKQITLNGYEINIADALREVRIFAKLDHPNIVRYFSSWIEFDNTIKSRPKISMFIQMQLCDKTLESWMRERTAIDFNANKKIFLQILNGIKYIHQNNFIHRDIKPGNIFLTIKENDILVKVGDFGMARFMDIDVENHLTDELGTLTYGAPEQIDSTNYNNKVDVYSAGIILFELCNNFKTDMERIKEITKLKHNEITFDGGDRWKELILGMTNVDPNKRYTIDECIELLGKI